MKWTTYLPTAPGHYWWRKRTALMAAKKVSTISGIGQLTEDPERGPMFRAGVTLPLVEFQGYEFAGPIPEPER